MSGNISGYNFLGGSFPGGIRQGGGGWLERIFRVGVFLIHLFVPHWNFLSHTWSFSIKCLYSTESNFKRTFTFIRKKY